MVPRGFNQRPLHIPKLIVWCDIGASEILDPIFFEEETVQITADLALQLKKVKTIERDFRDEEATIGMYGFNKIRYCSYGKSFRELCSNCNP
ncbi:hypothetical protein AVEN_272903-1 [Araneus ventricosus]|uniref:Uncharacterized protein n=1 Tax=Araneus ventricosus TaxID=182803 RepID=A0A4Y2VQA2_ARAVE|nr:hypothetical protein AVEN_246909-1 [Araneus ventricosus]GBO25981.1 hypothetical protein AVEN_170411-1 [Araneus ventricosus]GBO26314.1 hypothetical protein AVEN_183895-1 [Araneus ventricosus]GBO26441.1 hypothetical protein AVEN_272903-1 [Araneus ventricosus]